MFDDVEFYWKHKAELYRQNYEDALDEVRELRFRIRELEKENKNLRNDNHSNNNYILENYKYLYGK